MQDYNGTLFPVSYASKKLLDREERYSTSEKECLAVVWAIKKFEKYLYGSKFRLQTDHESLKYLQTAKYTNARLMRWAMFIQQYQANIEYINGAENVAADYMSRQFE